MAYKEKLAPTKDGFQELWDSQQDDARMGYTSLAQRIKNGEVTLSNRKGEYITGGDGEQDVEP